MSGECTRNEGGGSREGIPPEEEWSESGFGVEKRMGMVPGDTTRQKSSP